MRRHADIDSTGALDFSEFVTVFATYCTFGKEDVLKCGLWPLPYSPFDCLTLADLCPRSLLLRV